MIATLTPLLISLGPLALLLAMAVSFADPADQQDGAGNAPAVTGPTASVGR